MRRSRPGVPGERLAATGRARSCRSVGLMIADPTIQAQAGLERQVMCAIVAASCTDPADKAAKTAAEAIYTQHIAPALQREAELRLAICGGEDAPGYNASLPHETILQVLAENYASARRDAELAWDGDTATSWKARAETAERERDAYAKTVEAMGNARVRDFAEVTRLKALLGEVEGVLEPISDALRMTGLAMESPLGRITKKHVIHWTSLFFGASEQLRALLSTIRNSGGGE